MMKSVPGTKQFPKDLNACMQGHAKGMTLFYFKKY